MLSEFLTKERGPILERCKREATKNLGVKPTSELIEEGLPIFYDQLIGLLQRGRSFDLAPESGPVADANRSSATEAARNQGKEYLRLGYTVSEVVHGYGTIFQAITGAANDKDFEITAQEFRHLNLSLDMAIAEAVTEFQKIQTESVSHAEVKRLGFLAHELRNALMGASIALEMIESGDVGIRSATSGILGRSLQQMKELIDTSLTEVRLRIEPVAHFQRIKILEIIGEVKATAAREARNRNLTLVVAASGTIEVNVDRQLLVSALANLVQNAIKFSKPDGIIVIRARTQNDRVLLEVEDQCGGLQEEKIEELFRPFTQRDTDRTGIGLGLTISRRAVELNNGKLYARNLPDKGCIFVIDLPKA